MLKAGSHKINYCQYKQLLTETETLHLLYEYIIKVLLKLVFK